MLPKTILIYLLQRAPGGDIEISVQIASSGEAAINYVTETWQSEFANWTRIQRRHRSSRAHAAAAVALPCSSRVAALPYAPEGPNSAPGAR
eukprot:1279250-Pleurochrysis_carterae.AAC.1